MAELSLWDRPRMAPGPLLGALQKEEQISQKVKSSRRGAGDGPHKGNHSAACKIVEGSSSALKPLQSSPLEEAHPLKK
jgi:hypothetical protein